MTELLLVLRQKAIIFQKQKTYTIQPSNGSYITTEQPEKKKGMQHCEKAAATNSPVDTGNKCLVLEISHCR
jgi:hypothetical protein